jgi:hypothetical protein
MAQVGRPPKAAAKLPENGMVLKPISDEEAAAAREIKNEKPVISYRVLRLNRDGKNIVKVRRIESRKNCTDQMLVYQSVNGKIVREAIPVAELIKAGVDLNY